MVSAFWQAIGGKLADRAAAVSVPALIFWLGGLLAWIRHDGGVQSLARSTRWLDQQTSAVQVTAILTVLLAIAASGIMVSRAATPTLRLLEGYWPSWVDPLRTWLSERAASCAAAEETAWQVAYARVHPPATPTAGDLAAYTRIEQRRRRRPPAGASGYFLPTPIGNILRAAERRPYDKYGLDAIILWPRLWPALPDATRADLIAARMSLNTATSSALWGLFYCSFAPLTLLSIPIGLTVCAVLVVLIIPSLAQMFGDLIEAAYDQHRTLLYAQLRWPLPTNPQQEKDAGRLLTAYLWRGSDDTIPHFTPPA